MVNSQTLCYRVGSKSLLKDIVSERCHAGRQMEHRQVGKVRMMMRMI